MIIPLLLLHKKQCYDVGCYRDCDKKKHKNKYNTNAKDPTVLIE